MPRPARTAWSRKTRGTRRRYRWNNLPSWRHLPARSWTDRFPRARSNSSCGLATWREWRSKRARPTPIRWPALAFSMPFSSTTMRWRRAKDAEDALRRAGAGPEVGKERAAIVASARALLAHAAGERVAAKTAGRRGHGSHGRSDLRIRPAGFSARSQPGGDAGGHGAGLDRAMGIAPELAPVVVDWATSRLDGGDPVAARRALVRCWRETRTTRGHCFCLPRPSALWASPTGSRVWKRPAGATPRYRAASAPPARLNRPCRRASTAIAPGRCARPRRFRRPPRIRRCLAQRRFCLPCSVKPTRPRRSLERARKAADPANVPLLWADLAVRLSRGEPRSIPAASSLNTRPDQSGIWWLCGRPTFALGPGAGCGSQGSSTRNPGHRLGRARLCRLGAGRRTSQTRTC
jgi:hypothetical protein